MNSDASLYQIVPASEASPKALAAFYDRFFAERRFPLKYTWRWQNRTDYMQGKTPLVLLDGDRVIAHAGIIPFELKYQDKVYKASWYIDFMVDKEYRRKGLGLKITNAFIELSDIYFAVTGNDMSMGAFRKLGWAESDDSFIHYILLRPFNHPKLSQKLPLSIRKLLNTLCYPILYLFYLRYKASNQKISPISVSTIDQLEQTNFSTSKWTPVRDKQYWKWRLLESPDHATYKLFYLGEKYLIFKTQEDSFGKTVEIFFIPSKYEPEEKLKLIGALSFWALKNQYNYVRLYTTIPFFSKKIKSKLKSFITYPEFAYKSNDPDLFQKLQENPQWDFHFMDNDFELI